MTPLNTAMVLDQTKNKLYLCISRPNRHIVLDFEYEGKYAPELGVRDTADHIFLFLLISQKI
jgi:hypothetical protein